MPSDFTGIEQQTVLLARRTEPDVTPDGTGCLLQPTHPLTSETGRFEVSAVSGPTEQPPPGRACRTHLLEAREAGPQGEQDKHTSDRDARHGEPYRPAGGGQPPHQSTSKRKSDK